MQDTEQTALSNGNDTPAVPKRKPGRPKKVKPKLNYIQMGEAIVDYVHSLHEDPKPGDWRAVQTSLQYALRLGGKWGKMTRKAPEPTEDNAA